MTPGADASSNARRLETGDLRELVIDEHVILFAVTRSKVFVLSIRNQLESGFHLG